MKKGMTPQLDHKWWSKNKPTFLGKTGLGDALKDYAIAVDKFEHEAARKALVQVGKAVGVATKKCSDRTQKTTKEVLGKYDTVIKKADDELKDRIAGEQKKAAAGSGSAPVPPQKIGKDVVVWKRDIGERVMKKVKLDWLNKVNGFTLEQKLNDDILDVFEKEGDYVTPQQIVDDSEKIGEAAVAAIVKDLNKIDALIKAKKVTDAKQVKGLLLNVFDSRMQAAELKLKALPEARWKKFKAQKKQYTKYKIKTGVKLTTGSIGILAGVGGLGLGVAAAAGAVPSMGGSLALAIPGLVAGLAATLRSCAAMTKQIVDISRSAEKVEKVLASDLDTLKKRYLDASKAKIVAGETATSTLKGILGTDAPFLATIPKCNDNIALLKNKSAGLAVAMRKLSKSIMKALKEAEDLEAKLKGIKAAKVRKAYDKLIKTRAALSKALDKCVDTGARITNLEKNLPKLEQMMRALNDKNAAFNKIFDKVFPVVVGLTLTATSAGTGFADSSSVADFVSTSVGLVADISLEAADFAQDAA
ncbi:hypothetical protein SAMN05444007_11270 [Cribrihabitans marinus]|uniref:Uncharacterized protein n=1 Tax=Cribrihabitans marinus TaxID=1227549 RepID=A0A1H7DNJ3_9RHOB|nr:hypothetical protein [Cribrihabitans marinus]SEK03329.1 hypothetical protein SAMN05444007_11270 [Cribrihabitans marinus]